MASLDASIVETSLPELPEKKKAFLMSMAANCGEAGDTVANSIKTVSTGYNMPDMFNNKKYSDLQVKLHGDDEIYHCHKSIIGSHARYFDQVFEGNARLSQPGTVLVLQAPEELHPIYKHVLEFLYTGKVTFHKYDVFKYYFMAELIACEDLRQLCVSCLKCHLDVKVQDSKTQLKIPGKFGYMECDGLYVHQEIGESLCSVVVSHLDAVDKTYTPTEVLSFWSMLPDKEICHAASMWFASQMHNYSGHCVGSNFVGDGQTVTLSTELTMNQLNAVLDCDIQSIDEYNYFNLTTSWLAEHEGQSAESLLLKIRYAFMSIEERNTVLKNVYIKASPLLLQAVVNACFYFERLVTANRQLDEITNSFPEFRKKVYQPRKIQTVQV